MSDGEKKVIRKKLKNPSPLPELNAMMKARIQQSGDEAYLEWTVGAKPIEMKVVWAPSQSKFEYKPSAPPQPGERITWGLISASTLLPLATIITVLLVAPILRTVLDFALRHIPYVTQFAIFVMIVALGVALYVMRCRRQMAYGVSECGVGVVTAWYVANHLQHEDPSQWFSFLAALYVIVRGADNIHKSLKAAPFEKRWNMLFFGKHPLPS